MNVEEDVIGGEENCVWRDWEMLCGGIESGRHGKESCSVGGIIEDGGAVVGLLETVRKGKKEKGQAHWGSWDLDERPGLFEVERISDELEDRIPVRVHCG